MLKLLLSLLLASPVSATAADMPWSVTGLVGKHDDSRFLDILSGDGGQTSSSYLAGAVLGHHLSRWGRAVEWEAEAQLIRHHGEQSHWESNLALVVHWTRFPWGRWLDTRVSFAQGMSLASERPPLEEDTRRLLHYMHADIAFSLPHSERWSLVARIHHRSGAFGLYGAEGGSNFLTSGLRYRF